MQRNLNRMEHESFDVAVVGGGVHGATVAMEAAQRGLRVALVDQADFGSATSHNSLKIVHGGIRYLQHLDFGRVRQSILERRFWLRCAPHMVAPLDFWIPTRGIGTRGPAALWAAIQAHGLLGWDRNDGVASDRRLPAGRIRGPAAVRKQLADLWGDKPPTAAIWYDGQMLDSDRLVLECIESASLHGAAVANYAKCVDIRRSSSGKVDGVDVEDRQSGRVISVKSRNVVLAAGPWTPGVARELGGSKLKPANTGLVQNMNIVVSRRWTSCALGIESDLPSDAVVGKSKRLFFMTPWRDCSIIGTTHEPYEGRADDYCVTSEYVNDFVDEVAHSNPSLGLTHDDVQYVYAGLTPAEDASGGDARSRKAEIVDHGETERIDGLFSVLGVKYTTARSLAEMVVDRIGKSVPGTSESRSAFTPLPGAVAFESIDRMVEKVMDSGVDSREQAEDFAIAYGSRFKNVLRLAESTASDESLLQARTRFAVSNEMALKLSDVVFRRLDWAPRGKVTSRVLEYTSSVMAEQFGWDEATRLAELESVKASLKSPTYVSR